MQAVSKYFSDIWSTAWSVIKGLQVTIYYFLRPKTVITLQYPRVKEEVPERHRGIHYLETEKCVMCFKCADICPVDCIYIEGVRDADGILKNGFRGKRATMSKFCVDYGVCIFCGLCEEPCPTVCIHLGPEFDYSTTDPLGMVKNLLTDAPFGEADQEYVLAARTEIAAMKEERKRKAAEKKTQAAAAKAAAEKAQAEKAGEKGDKGTDEKRDEKGDGGEGGASG